MELLYTIPTIEEGEADEFITYGVEWHVWAHEPTGWYKKQQPSYCNTPSSFPHVIEDQKRYFNISNREDMIMLQREKEAFDMYYQKEFKELSKYV
jgi:hypothetical protein